MSVLNFKFSDAKRPLVSETRRKTGREVVLDGIQHQLALLKDSTYKIERTKYVRSESGESLRQTITAPPRPWWWQASDGVFLVQIRYGHSVVLELEEGKPTIIGTKDIKSVSEILTQVADAVKAGKLDKQIEMAREKAKRNRQQADQAA
ncbi:DUF6641 family protein [Magnetospirillum sp. 15-1]|uniref:DUF6641 family protein n=1 Tax=Magnetospirillum sp. 15-1 TaxID=1979370 RepID=UPI001F5B728F|nr:DUF6641 family protein [Magnetospirillum sp. 15-1]